MKVLQINTFYKHGSTGRIVFDLLRVQKTNGITPFVAYGPDTTVNKNDEVCTDVLRLQNIIQRKLNILCSRLFDHHGFYNEVETRKLIRWMDEIRPDIIHLHNIHNHYVNVKMLFEYIKQHDIPVIWTLHDCWSFTGHCAYFDLADCDKWKTECHNCSSLKNYPKTWFFDNTTETYREKKSVFQGVRRMVLCPPSKWLGNLARESFLQEYPIKIINNGVDTEIFKPTKTNIKYKYGIEGKKVLLAVVAGDIKRKGTDFLKMIPGLLSEDEILVWVGVDGNEIGINDEHFLAISRTDSREELAVLYSSADCFINTTLEENFPTINIESLACGTPIVTFDTGGSIEAVMDDDIINEEGGIRYTKVGAVVEKGNIDDLLVAVRKVINTGKQHYLNNCVCKARKRYDKGKQYQKYIELYNLLIK